MAPPYPDSMVVRSSDELVRVRQVVRALAVEAGFNLVDQTKLVTAASELSRNMLDHGGGEGLVRVETMQMNGRRGLRLMFEDKGPGIADIEQAMKDGFSTRGGLGLGLSGAKRLVNEFSIVSAPGQGTKVTITRWTGA